MKRIIILITVLLLYTLPTLSQKPELKNIKITYTQLPLKPLDKEIKTYNSKLIIDINNEDSDKEKYENQYLKLQGYTKSTDADVFITVEFEDFKVNTELITKDVYNVNEGKNMTGYYYKVKCEYPTNLILTGKDGEVIYKENIAHKESLISFDYGKWTYSSKDLENKLKSEEEKFRVIKNKCDKNALTKIKKILISKFSYAQLTKKIKIATGKSKKHDYSDLNKAIEHMEDAFIKISKQEDGNDDLKNAVNIWINSLNESSKDKKAKINEGITTMLYYNLSIAHWWMKDFEKALVYTEKALKNNSESTKPSSQYEKLIKETVENIKDYKKRLEIHGNM